MTGFLLGLILGPLLVPAALYITHAVNDRPQRRSPR